MDFFSIHISFHKIHYKNKESKNAHLQKLNKITLETLSNANAVIIISDASIKDNVATLISCSNPIKKTLHHTINITITEAKLFTIRCGINQAIQVINASHIIIITDAIYLAQHIFDSLVHSY